MHEIKLNFIDDTLYTRKLDLDLTVQKNTANNMYEFIRTNFVDDNSGYTGQSTLTTKLFNKYNYLLYPVPGNNELYHAIKDTFYAALAHSSWYKEKNYYIQCWLNFYNRGDYIDWHHHGGPEMRSWHGFYCVDVEPNSFTTYKLPNKNHETVVKSENNLLVLGPTNGDLHKSSEWNQDYPRVTIAFDITSGDILFQRNLWQTHNHWIPL